MNKLISEERKKYLKSIKRKKYLILLTQILILTTFLGIWEWMANKNIIDSFITSQPSRIFDTFMNLSSNDLLKHIGVTVYETVVGFLLGTTIGNNRRVFIRNYIRNHNCYYFMVVRLFI